MKCKNCGNELQDNALFCGVCGTKVENEQPIQQDNTQAQQASQFDNSQAQQTSQFDNSQAQQASQFDNSQAQQASQFDNSQAPVPPKKKKKAGKIIGAICGIAVIAIAGTGVALAATGQLSNFVHKNFSSPESYLKYVAKQNVEDNIEVFNSNYSKYLETVDTDNLSGNVKIELSAGSALKPLIGLLSPDLKKLDNAAIEVNTNLDGEVQNMEVAASVNDTTVATLKASVDLENKKGYAQIPELSEGYIDFSDAIEEASDELEDYTDQFSEAASQLTEILPDAEAVSNILTKYSDIAYDNIDDVTKSTETIKANGVSSKCTALTANLDGTYSYDVACDILETLSEDEDIKDIISAIDKDTYNDFVDGLEDTLDEIKDSKDEFKDLDMDMDMTFYVNAKGEIIGEEVNMSVESQDINITCLMPQSGSKFGYLLSAEASGTEMFNLEGGGTIKNNVMNGSFTLDVADELAKESELAKSGNDILSLEISDLNVEDVKAGNLNGSFKLKSDAISEISGYELLVDVSSDDKSSTVEMAVASDSEEWARIKLTASEGKKLDTLKPSKSDKIYSVTDEDDLKEYVEDIDLDAFAKNLSKATGIDISADDITSFIEDAASYAGLGSDDTSYDYDYDNLWNDDSYDYDYDDLWNDDSYDSYFNYDDSDSSTNSSGDSYSYDIDNSLNLDNY